MVMTRFRGTSRVASFGTRNLARIAVAGILAGGAPLAFAGTANAATAVPTSGGDGVWDNIAQCESGGKWNTDTGNGYSGGLQFSPSTWRAYGGKGSAHGASRSEQISVAKRVVASQGWNAWPSCSKKAGASGSSSKHSSKHSSSEVSEETSSLTSSGHHHSHSSDDD
jgi:resuscitation-promoting factor RpfA